LTACKLEATGRAHPLETMSSSGRAHPKKKNKKILVRVVPIIRGAVLV